MSKNVNANRTQMAVKALRERYRTGTTSFPAVVKEAVIVKETMIVKETTNGDDGGDNEKEVA